MKRVSLGNGRWFNEEAAEAFEDDTRWDGHNHISIATGSQWVRATLWRTAKGLWVLETRGPHGSSYEHPYPADGAHRWLIDNGHVSAVPEQFMQEMEV